MTSFCIGSPHKNVNWYDYRVYVNLIAAMESLGFKYQRNSANRIYFLGGPLRDKYTDIDNFEENANNIALMYCHSGSVQTLIPFSKIFVASLGMKIFTLVRKIKKADFYNPRYLKNMTGLTILPPFSSLQPNCDDDARYKCDISFVGNNRVRPIVEDVLGIVSKHNLNFKIYGDDWLNYQGSQNAIKYWAGATIPYEDIPNLAYNSRICLVDHHSEMNREGTVSSKYIDLSMSKACVISDNNWGVKAFAGKSYKTKADLEKLIIELLAKPSHRNNIIEKQYSLVKQNTTLNAALEISKYFI